MTDLGSILPQTVPVRDIPAGGLPVTVTPTADQRAKLASFNGLVAVRAMSAALMLRPEGPQGVHVTGAVEAEITQTCVVSLEPFDSAVREEVDVHLLTPEALAAYRAARGPVTAEDEENPEDEPDVIEHGVVEVGNLVAEHLTLGLDPYPRKPGAALAPQATTDEPEASPFAVLRQLGEKQS